MTYDQTNYLLLGNHCHLKVNDYIDLPVNGEIHKLKVERTFFSQRDIHKEAEFLDFMDVPRDEFANKIYGYKNYRPDVNGFPDYKDNDMVAATLYALALFDYFCKLSKPEKILKLDTIKIL